MHLRLGLPHAAPAQLYGVDRCTVSASVRGIRPLLAALRKPGTERVRGAAPLRPS
ncbi:transposase family protein [Streptomyces arenae]|nr:transposase family protein [Streptomyces arenae]